MTTRALSQYMTPAWAAQLLVERHFADLGSADLVLEPACGRGAFLQAVPAEVPAVGVEVDPALAAEAAATTGRRVLIGDFLSLDLALLGRPSLVLGNPPFAARTVEGFIGRAWRLLEDEGRCGFILPAYLAQTPQRVMGWASRWSLWCELLPRTLFPRSRLPLLFVVFRKGRARTLVGFGLYAEARAIENVSPDARMTFAAGRPRVGVGRAVVEATPPSCASLQR